jgi:hypothetical protein
MRIWQARYGRLPSSYDWSRTHARRRGGDALERLGEEDWPSPSVVSHVYGSWQAVPISLATMVEHMHNGRLASLTRKMSPTDARPLLAYVGSLTAQQERDIAGARDRLAILAESDVGHLLEFATRCEQLDLRDRPGSRRDQPKREDPVIGWVATAPTAEGPRQTGRGVSSSRIRRSTRSACALVSPSARASVRTGPSLR